MIPKEPKISIITINLNNLEGLRKTLESVRLQTYTNFELIVVDGGSTDGSFEYLKSNLNLIKKFISEKDKGIYNAQNKGILLSKGEYLVFLNAGDALLQKDVLSEISKFLEQDIDLVYGDILIDSKDYGIIERKYPDRLNYFYWSIKSLCHQATFIRKNLFDLYGYYNEEYSFAADFEFFHRFWFNKNIKIKHAPVFVILYDFNGVSAQPKNRKRIAEEYRKIKRKYFPIWAYVVYKLNSYLLEKLSNTFLWKILFKFYRFLNPKK
ncbi:PGL/P-HBAD biosynthesis glycosyltransferase family protein [Leptospira kirschneri serovar Bim str. 1051]|uniref:glycosyltransferase family 2 protein n=1 Tax=Leptospira kirschneri TaxID=29507 RepID=UPI0002886FD0|nr:glycosyltransferase family 2 protein [Leptospira kirschneri]EMK15686.1 PGL/P-HBAD biosynthesis glycosyltransferase family protein [Leptospira kirschneri serovar Bim str. PUO 1247]EMN04938.1 PGL/P-HBAD biosynthesis glycosyltransferase family protein [Leptospira kirschneri serovar Bim str. 1051]